MNIASNLENYSTCQLDTHHQLYCDIFDHELQHYHHLDEGSKRDISKEVSHGPYYQVCSCN